MFKIIFIYLLLINIITFFLFGMDKWKAKKGKWRISEKCLLIFSFAGGSIGALLGMRAFHHKTLKTLFRILVPLSLILHILLMLFFFYLSIIKPVL